LLVRFLRRQLQPVVFSIL